MDWRDKTAIITGASSGIGEATARRIAKMGLRVVLIARRLNRLSGLKTEIESAGGKARVIAANLGSESDRFGVFERVQRGDVLVNNAGLGWYGDFNKMTWGTGGRSWS